MTKDGVAVLHLGDEHEVRRISEADYASLLSAGAVLSLAEFSSETLLELLLKVTDPRVVDRIPKVVEEVGITERCYILVDDILWARSVATISDSARTALLVRNPFPNAQLIARERVSAVALPASLIRPRLVEEFKRLGIRVFTWLVNDVSQAMRVVRHGVDSLITSRRTLKKELQHYLTYA
ncbi:MAG: glycerophosphodiester phosphodiesterase [Sulfolobales archaeon]